MHRMHLTQGIIFADENTLPKMSTSMAERERRVLHPHLQAPNYTIKPLPNMSPSPELSASRQKQKKHLHGRHHERSLGPSRSYSHFIPGIYPPSCTRIHSYDLLLSTSSCPYSITHLFPKFKSCFSCFNLQIYTLRLPAFYYMQEYH